MWVIGHNEQEQLWLLPSSARHTWRENKHQRTDLHDVHDALPTWPSSAAQITTVSLNSTGWKKKENEISTTDSASPVYRCLIPPITKFNLHLTPKKLSPPVFCVFFLASELWFLKPVIHLTSRNQVHVPPSYHSKRFIRGRASRSHHRQCNPKETQSDAAARKQRTSDLKKKIE